MAPSIPGFNVALVRLAMDFAYAAYNGTKAFRGGQMHTAYTKNSVYHPVYYLYERDSTLFVVVRGSASNHDWKTNLDYSEREAYLGKYRINVHGGYLQSAQNIYRSIRPKLLEHSGNIIFTGHSLGAAVASVISVMAMTDPKLQSKLDKMGALCFASPPALAYIPKHLVPKICVFVYKHDIVPTLSIANAYKLIEPFAENGIPKELLKLGFVSAIEILKETNKDFSQNLYNAVSGKIDAIIDDIVAYHKDKSRLKIHHIVGTVYALDSYPGKLEDCRVSGSKYSFPSISKTALADHYQSKYVRALQRKTD